MEKYISNERQDRIILPKNYVEKTLLSSFYKFLHWVFLVPEALAEGY